MRHWQTTGSSHVTIQTGLYLRQYDSYHYNNSDGKPAVFDEGELAESVSKWL